MAFRQRGRFDAARGGVRPWLYGIATNLIGRHRRSELRRYRALARTGPPPDDEGHDERVVDRVAAGVTVARLSEALAGLSKGERDVVLLVAYGGLTHLRSAAVKSSSIQAAGALPSQSATGSRFHRYPLTTRSR
ncbi:RNA polymerase sigma factor [Streptosporangium sp. NBC_01469]|uniref:RNA polymerase sigma factor n=1 Tax=Streptosporangium sp. NBC_01469 TaxID=2903898 RepID=UPI002E2CF68F|nr:hypothetical protein [Streptosporangium sp. NBC_01469]